MGNFDLQSHKLLVRGNNRFNAGALASQSVGLVERIWMLVDKPALSTHMMEKGSRIAHGICRPSR